MNEWLTENWEDIRLMAKKVCKSDPQWEEVCSYSIEKFMLHERALEFIETGKAMNFLSGIMHLSFYSSTSSYHYDIRQRGRVYGITEGTQLPEDDIIYNEDQDNVLEVIKIIMEEMIIISKETWFMVVLFQMWMETPNYSQIARETLVPRTSVSRAVQDCRAYIKAELKKRGFNDYEF